jgi:predicted nucleic acid-binding protein
LIVLDASAAIELLLNTKVGQKVARRISNPDLTLHAPHLIDLEVAQVLRRLTRAGALTAARGAQALEHLSALDIERYPHDILLTGVWTLRDRATAYDAAYLVLADLLDGVILTTDKKLAAVSARAEVVV